MHSLLKIMERYNNIPSFRLQHQNRADILFWLYWACIIYVRMETIKVTNCACVRNGIGIGIRLRPN